MRELRNYLERCLVFEEALASPRRRRCTAPRRRSTRAQPYAEQRRRMVDDFERRYLRALLEKHQGKVANAAITAGMDRVHLYRLLRRHGIKP